MALPAENPAGLLVEARVMQLQLVLIPPRPKPPLIRIAGK